MIRALVVEDDQIVMEVICELLQLGNIDVIGRGSDGKEAVELFRKLKPDIVLLDVMMPRYDGFYALQKIRQYNPLAKVIIVTADLTYETEKKLKGLKASAIAYKPYDVDTLIETIQKVYQGEQTCSVNS
jgi:DNA-binding NarL/FixJ family response regulator